MFDRFLRPFRSDSQSTNVPRRKKRVLLFVEQLETRLMPAANPYEVTGTADDPNVKIPGVTTLRDAINAANASNNQTITFAQGVSGSIQLQAALPSLQKNITIDGPTQGGGISVLGSGASAPVRYGVFRVNAGITCQINNLTIENGYVSFLSGGAGIFNTGGKVTISAGNIDFNYADNGGGIYVSGGTLTVKTSTVIQTNQADGNGGGMYINSGTVSMSGGTIKNNMAVGGNGGGIFILAGSLTLANGVTIRANASQLRCASQSSEIWRRK